MSAKNPRLIGGGRAAATMASSNSNNNPNNKNNDSPPRTRKSPRNRIEATKAKLSQIGALNNLKHEIVASSDNEEEDKISISSSKEASPFHPSPIRLGFFTTPIKKLHCSSPRKDLFQAMRWCCGGLSEARGGGNGITTANGGSNGRRQQLTIQGDQVVLDATTAAALNNLHSKDEPRPSTSSAEAYQFTSSSESYGGGGIGRGYKTTTTPLHPVSTTGQRRNSEGKIIFFDNNQDPTSIQQQQHSPRNAALIMDKYGPMLLRPCKSALYITPNPPSNSTTTSSTTTGQIFDSAFLERLRQSDWQIHCCNSILANSEVQKHRPVVIIFDNKLNDLTAVSRSLHALPESEDVLFGVLSDRILSDKRKRALLKCELHEYFLSSSIDISICELFAKLAARLRAIPALFAVVEEAEQPIKICDERNIVQYVNRAYEIQTGCSRAEVLGSFEGELHSKSIIHHTSAVSVAASTTLPPHPPPPLHIIGSTPLNTDATMDITPVTPSPQQHENTGSIGNVSIPHSFNPNRRRSSEWHCITVPGSSNPQFVYVKRGSADATICRDLSLKSLRSQSALVDAPITEALTVLANVLHKCDDETQPMVRDAIKILSSNELYAPTITRFQNNDRIASGYYDGLIRLHHPSRQRKRSVVDAFREQRRASGSDSRRRISSDVVNALENEDSWHFDVIELERVTEHHPLSHLGAKVFERWNCVDVLRCSADTIARWLTVIEANYQNTNTYHNATHAADVLQATSFFLNSETVAQTVQDHHATAALIAATVHDLDHPGRGNAFLINTRQRLALLYNDQSVLENHHVALAFQLTLAQSGINIFAKMQREEFIQMRQSIIDMVLATDMSRHFEYLTKFQQVIPNLPDLDENRESNSMTVCRMMIKCADIANPTREWKLCAQWARRIVEEYFFQTAEEREKGLPLTMKGFERETCNVPMTQCTFVDMFAREAFTLWCDFAEIPQLLNQLETNYDKWKQMSTSWEPSQNVDLMISKSA